MSDAGDYEIWTPAGEEAEEGSERKLGAFPNPPLDLCPVVPLGFHGGKVVFAMPEGEIRQELAAKIASLLKTDIFACASGQAFLTTWRDSEDKFQRDLAAIWFNRKCRDAGFWDVSRPIRSLGVWPGDARSVILHRGCELIRYTPDGKATKASVAEALRSWPGPLYKLSPARPMPAEACDLDVGGWVRSTLDRWRFEAIGSEGLTGADIVAGWMMAASLGAVAPFRGHLMLNALAGSGKSTLIEFLHALLSAVAGDVVDSFSGAGFRNELAGMARPVLVDEAEASAAGGGPSVLEQCLEVIRRMATGDGGNRKQGDIGGGVVTQTAIGAVLLAGINTPKLGPADASRMIEIRLLSLRGRRPDEPRFADDAELQGAIERAKALAPALLGRALHGAWRFRSDFDRLKAAFVRTREAPRTADLLAMIAAGRRLLMFDDPLTDEDADAEVVFWRPLLLQREASETVSNPGADALAHLMSWNSGQHSRDRQLTIGELISKWIGDAGEYDEALKAHGLRLFREAWEDGSPGPWLLVANNHPVLERIFERTPWRDWRKSLGYLDDLGDAYQTRHPAKPQRFGVGIQQRAIAIPLAPWLGRVTGGVPGVTPRVTGQADEW